MWHAHDTQMVMSICGYVNQYFEFKQLGKFQ